MGMNKVARLFIVAATIVIITVAVRAKDIGPFSIPSRLQPPCRIVQASEMEDDWVSTSVTLFDARGRRLTCSWGEDGVVVGTKARTIRTEPGDAEEQILLKRLKGALAAIYNPAFDKAHDTIPNQLGAGDPRWFTQKAVQRMIKELSFRCKYKRQPTYEESDPFDKQGPVSI
jgi:hypothetical protein